MDNAKDLIVIAFIWVAILYCTSNCYIAIICTIFFGTILIFKNKSNRKFDYSKEMDLQRQYFVETLIHDLKIPTLAQLRGLEVVKKEMLGTLNDEQKELITQIEGSCNYVLDMISMVLKTYQFENGSNKFVLEKFNMEELLAESFNEITPIACAKNIEFNLLNSDNSSLIVADRENIKTVVTNLLSNAILYSDRNEKINVNIKQNRDYLKFEVVSKGDTLSEKECTLMFNKTNDVPRYTTVGYGIGLYLCKKIIESHNGKICALKDGRFVNKFIFTLPLSRTRVSAI